MSMVDFKTKFNDWLNSSKIFEKMIFDSIYDFIDKNNLFNNTQSGFSL